MDLKKLSELIFGKPKQKTVYTPIEAERIKDNEIIKKQQQKIVTQEVQLAKIKALEKQSAEKEKEKDKESERNKKLKEQELDLKANIHGKVIKLGKFYKKLYSDKNFRDKLEIVDKHDETVIGKFGDFVLMEGGYFGIIDREGELRAKGKTLNQVLYKPDGFENQARRGRFTLPVDKDGNWLEDIDYVEINEPMESNFDEETGKIRWSRVKTSNVKKVVARLVGEKNEIAQELEYEENVNIKLKSQIDDLTRALRKFQNEADISSTELDKALLRTSEIERRFYDVHSQVVKLMEVKATYEQLINAKDNQIQIVISKLDKFTDPQYELIKTSIMDDLERAKELLPEKVEIKQEAPIPVREPAKPGEVIK